MLGLRPAAVPGTVLLAHAPAAEPAFVDTVAGAETAAVAVEAAVVVEGLCLPGEGVAAQHSQAPVKVGEAGVAALQVPVGLCNVQQQMHWCHQQWTQSHLC